MRAHELFGYDGVFDIRTGCDDGPVVGDGGIGDYRCTLPARDFRSEPVRRATEDAFGIEYGAPELSAASDSGAGCYTNCVAAGAIRDSATGRVAESRVEPGVCARVRAAW